MGQKGAWLRSRDLLLNFGPLLSLERLKLQNSNFAGGLRLRGTKQRNQKWAKGALPGSRDVLLNFGTHNH